jgi:glutamine transport system permease protein
VDPLTSSLQVILDALPMLLQGVLITIKIVVISLSIAFVIGLIAVLMSTSHNKILRSAATIYVDLIRGTPLLVQVFFIYFGLPVFLDIRIPAEVAGIAAISLNAGAYISEVFRAGIKSISKGQMEAARSLGMTYRQAMSHIVLPQAIKRVIPPLGNEFIAMLKDSSLVSVIGMEELVRKAQIIVTRSYRPTETWLEVGLVFLMMTIPFTRIVANLERRFKVSD